MIPEGDIGTRVGASGLGYRGLGLKVLSKLGFGLCPCHGFRASGCRVASEP